MEATLAAELLNSLLNRIPQKPDILYLGAFNMKLPANGTPLSTHKSYHLMQVHPVPYGAYAYMVKQSLLPMLLEEVDPKGTLVNTADGALKKAISKHQWLAASFCRASPQGPRITPLFRHPPNSAKNGSRLIWGGTPRLT